MQIKPLHIAIIILLGIGVATVISLYGNTTQYVGFETAENMAKENPKKEFHVVCKINKSKGIKYNPQENPNLTEFYAIDTLGKERKVVYLNSKPADMDTAEKLVIIGSAKENYFQATQILSKCPSKYEGELTSAQSNEQ